MTEHPTTGRSNGLRVWATTALAGVTILVASVGSDTGHLLAGIVGVVALVTARALVDAPTAFVIGQIALVAVLGTVFALELAIIGEASLGAMLLAADRRGAGRWQFARMAGTFAVLGLVGWSASSLWPPQWAPAVALLGIGGLIGYTLHRYEQVRLGVVSDE